MKICLLLPSFLPAVGGLEKAADTMAGLLHAWGHEPVILTQALRKTPGTVERPFPIRTYARPRSATWWPGTLMTALMQERFDLIWAFQAYTQGYAAVRVGLRQNVPVVISSRGGDISDRSRYLARWLPRRRIQWALKHAQAVTVLNRHLEKRVSDLTRGTQHAHLIFNGISLPMNRPAETPTPPSLAGINNRPFMLTMTRLHRFKGIDLIIEAMRLTRARGADTPMLVVAGTGSQEESLREQAVASGLRDAILFVGDMSGPDKAWLLAHCHFLVQPSREGEGMPNSVLEAMSYGKPILGTTAPGIQEIVQDGVNGILASPDDARLLAVGLERVLASNLTKLGLGAARCALDNSWENCAQQYLTLFEKVLNHRNGH
ncbi:MAG: glycosyltransferase family 4 protein [Planctomycetes bacterium]|nr:glycosyltransferase family 4 protein [Planctomycetota bacterium]